MYRTILSLTCVGCLLLLTGCDIQAPERPPAAPGGLAPAGGLDELSQPVKSRPAPPPPTTTQPPPANQNSPPAAPPTPGG
jgi:hypothetical protein